MNDFHKSVLQNEIVDYLHVTPGKVYIDATVGGGGHTEAILERGGVVLGIDVDQDALKHILEKIKRETTRTEKWRRLVLAKGNFKDVNLIATQHGFEKVDGILFDLGVSSHQLDSAERGFSFQQEGPLDMRMDQELTVKASDLISGLTQKELSQFFARYAEERFAKKIAAAIVSYRKEKSFETTRELASLIERVAGGRSGRIHPATRIFQALRVAVNDELNNLERGLAASFGLLQSGGRVAVISFHSLEDRIVKKTFLSFEKKGDGRILTRKPITPSKAEIAQNRRSRSAKLRVFEKK